MRDADRNRTDSADLLRRLFDVLIELAPEARQMRLRELDLDVDVRSRLEALLRAEEANAPLLDRPVTAAIEGLGEIRHGAGSLSGSAVGPFRILDQLGEGGSSVVFRAQRAAGAGTQFVALKLMRTGLFSAEGQKRFGREQAILAQLTHPNIARLVEAGVSEAGVPYIAMELVDGLPITEAAEQRALDLRQRLECFVTLCRAVQAAHAALIVHRDLKPSNVLLTRQGQVKILDFGIAKLLDNDADGTRTESIALTPEYAAPEQFRPGPVTTACDVYALGVLLGELLTGLRPSAGNHRGVSSLVTQQVRYEPPRGMPDRGALVRSLLGDLDAIVATAMAEEPEQRYRSVSALADDIERHLGGRPVEAHPPTRWYRTRKFVQRHRGGVAITALLVLAILASLVFALLQAHRANGEAALAKATRTFLVDVFRQTEPAGPRVAQPSVAEVTEAALSRVDKEQSNPRVRLDLKTQLGAVLRRQGRVERAIEVLQQAGDDGAAHFGAADPMVFDARCRLGEALIAGGRYDEANELVLALSRIAPQQDRQRRIDYELFALNIATKQSRIEDALARAEAAEALCRSGCDDGNRLAVLAAKGVVLTDLGRHADAAATFEQAVALAERMHGPTHVEVATALNSLSGAYRRLGRLREAKELGLRVIAIDDAVLPALHWRRSIHWNYLGNVHLGLEEDAAALAAFQQAVEQSRAVSGDEDPSLSMDFSNIGVLYARLGQSEKAIAAFRDALRRAEAGYGARNRITTRLRATFAYNLALLGDLDGAVPMMKQALADLRALEEPAPGYLFDALRQAGKLHLLGQQFDLALVALDEAERLAADPAAGIRESNRLAAQVTRGLVLIRLNRSEQAKPLLEQALQRLQTLVVDSVSRAEAHLALAGIALRQTDCTRATEHRVQARALLDGKPFVHPHVRAEQASLASALRAARCIG